MAPDKLKAKRGFAVRAYRAGKPEYLESMVRRRTIAAKYPLLARRHRGGSIKVNRDGE